MPFVSCKGRIAEGSTTGTELAPRPDMDQQKTITKYQAGVSLETRRYLCPSDYGRILAQKVYEQTKDPFDEPPRPRSGIIWDPPILEYLKILGLHFHDGFSICYARGDLIYTADRAGHNELVALHRKYAIQLVATRTEQAGADQPATQPADKPSEKDQPSPPTSKDGPR